MTNISQDEFIEEQLKGIRRFHFMIIGLVLALGTVAAFKDALLEAFGGDDVRDNIQRLLLVIAVAYTAIWWYIGPSENLKLYKQFLYRMWEERHAVTELALIGAIGVTFAVLILVVAYPIMFASIFLVYSVFYFAGQAYTNRATRDAIGKARGEPETSADIEENKLVDRVRDILYEYFSNSHLLRIAIQGILASVAILTAVGYTTWGWNWADIATTAILCVAMFGGETIWLLQTTRRNARIDPVKREYQRYLDKKKAAASG